MTSHIQIKNMVCPRCIQSVTEILKDIHITPIDVKLGEVVLETDLSIDQKEKFKEGLLSKGFELLQEKNAQLIAQIKSLVIEQIHLKNEALKFNYSTLIAEKLNQDYSSLSRLFSSVEGITIEKYILKQKIEKVKELIFYDELNLSEIAHALNYSSAAHLSNQFKKETGMTPSQFSQLKGTGRKSIDAIV